MIFMILQMRLPISKLITHSPLLFYRKIHIINFWRMICGSLLRRIGFHIKVRMNIITSMFTAYCFPYQGSGVRSHF